MAQGFGGVGWQCSLWREGKSERLAGPSGTRPWLKVMDWRQLTLKTSLE